jgi:endonuclease YncB( thermonuclease family)
MLTLSSASAGIPFDLKLTLSDLHGQIIESSVVGNSILVRSNITNGLAESDSFLHVLQVKDQDNRVVFLSSTTFEIQGTSSESISSSWSSEIPGLYTIQALVWPNVQSPSEIAFSASHIQVDNDLHSAIQCSGSASCFTGAVTRVIDGDTINVGNVTVRFTLVDTAERGEAMYDEAKMFTSSHCAVGSTVLVDEDDGQTSGSFGRMIAKVYCGDRSINEELLESDNAIILVQHCDESEFANEQWAKNYGC